MAARRGRVAVSITADNAPLHRGLRQSETDISRFGKVSESSLHGLHKAAGLALGVTGLGGLAFGVKDVAQEAVRAQAEEAKLAQAVKNAGLSWKGHREEVEKNLSALTEHSTFTKSELSASLANMLRTTGNLSAAWKDNTIAMNIATTKGMDLAGAQSLVARAALGNTRGLKSLGIEIKPVTAAQDQLKAATQKLSDEMRNSSGATKEQIQSAKEHLAALKDQAKQQDANATRTRALTLLEQKFHGQAAVAAKTSSGRFLEAEHSLQVAQETIGSALLPELAKGSQQVAKLAQGFSKDWPQIEKSVKPVAEDIAHVATGVGKFVGQHPELLKVAGTFAGIALSVKAIEKAGSITGITRLLGLGRSAASTVAGRGGGGVGGAVLGTRGASPVNPVFVAVVDGAPGKGGGAVSTVEKQAKRFAPLAARAVRAVPAVEVAGGAVAFGASQLGTAALLNKLLPGDSPLGSDARTRRALSGIASSTTDPNVAISKALAQIRTLRAEEDKVMRMGGDDRTSKDYDRQVAAIQRFIDKMRQLGGVVEQSKVAAEFDQMRSASGKSLQTIGHTVATTTAAIKLRLGEDSAAGRAALAHNFDLAIGDVRAAMHAGVVATDAGLTKIRSLLRAELKTFGLNDSQISGAIRLGAADPGGPGNYGGAKGHAVGGYIGRPGESGADRVPIVVGRGEAVLNRHQQRPVEAALRATYGIGLRDVFSTVRKPHYMASGGIATGGAMTIPHVEVSGGGTVGVIANAALARARTAALGYFDKRASAVRPSAVGGGGGPAGRGTAAGSAQLRAWAALQIAAPEFATPQNIQALVGRIMQESGGNGGAINLWDSNAKAGHPSKGLGQTIDSTFQSYRDPSLPNDIYNPIANLVASINYMYARYGHVVGNTGVGYQQGGFVGSDGGSIDDYDPIGYAAGAGGVGGQINQIVGGVPAPNGPKAPRARRPTRAKRRRAARHVKELASTAVAVQRARAGYQAAVAHGSHSSIRAKASGFRIAIGRRKAAIHSAIPDADNNTKAALYRELSTLAGYDHSIGAELKRLDAKPKAKKKKTVLTGDMQSILPLIQDQLDTVDLHVQAGDITDAEATAEKVGIIDRALAAAQPGGSIILSPGEQLQLRATEHGLLTPADTGAAAGSTVDNTAQQLIDALNNVKDELKRVNDSAAQVKNVEIGTLAKSLADFLSNQIGGQAYPARARTAGSGQLARYAGVGG